MRREVSSCQYPVTSAPRKRLSSQLSVLNAQFTKLAMAAGITLGLSSGCVRRTVTVNTQPQGATVVLNDEVVGTSPVSTDFLWYGDYDVIIRKPGYETLKTHHRLNAPWYQLPGLDFIAEALVPFEIHDRQQMAFELQPEPELTRAQLLEHARRMREDALYGTDEGPATRPAE